MLSCGRSSDFTPNLNGFCNDPAYQDAQVLSLPRYEGGGQAIVHLLRRDNALWACFTNLARGDSTLSG